MKGGTRYVYALLVTLLYWCLRGMSRVMLAFRKLQSQVTPYSVKTMIDLLPTGLMVCNQKGRVGLINAQMEKLLMAVVNRPRYQGGSLMDCLSPDRVSPDCQVRSLERNRVCLLADGSAWMFRESPLEIDGKAYTQVTASNISARWAVLEHLEHQNRFLADKTQALKVALTHLQENSEREEIKKARMQAHDILGQRLSLLLRAFQEDRDVDDDLVLSLVENLSEDIKKSDEGPSPEEEVRGIIRIFAPIGVGISFQGALPQDEKLARVIVAIVREGVTNAVRHGYARSIWIEGRLDRGSYYLSLANNGVLPSLPLKEGSGLQGIRGKIAPFQGELKVGCGDVFTLSVKFEGVT